MLSLSCIFTDTPTDLDCLVFFINVAPLFLATCFHEDTESSPIYVSASFYNNIRNRILRNPMQYFVIIQTGGTIRLQFAP